MFEIVNGRTMDGQRSDWYTISSPMSLRLRWAKNLDHGTISDQWGETYPLSHQLECQYIHIGLGSVLPEF